MASLSLPRVLQLKKNSLDAEREQFEKFQVITVFTLCIPKLETSPSEISYHSHT
ncbi:hypothetical protein RR46_11376 [Papilio xuthus]|uniref:Uncharacterized protein n=1 Tax=Papilio xuthus TaxID=66420 RepID=A0A194PRT2_PAPXU|nr:hypothetical protein RR46_11376 [Papilio xuthus]